MLRECLAWSWIAPLVLAVFMIMGVICLPNLWTSSSRDLYLVFLSSIFASIALDLHGYTINV